MVFNIYFFGIFMFRGSVAVASGAGDRGHVTCDKWQVTGDRWQGTHNTWNVTYIKRKKKKKMVLMLLSAHVKRFSVSRIQGFYLFFSLYQVFLFNIYYSVWLCPSWYSTGPYPPSTLLPNWPDTILQPCITPMYLLFFKFTPSYFNLSKKLIKNTNTWKI